MLTFLPGIAGLNRKQILSNHDLFMLCDSETNMWNNKSISKEELRAALGVTVYSVNGLTGDVTLGIADLSDIPGATISNTYLGFNGTDYVWTTPAGGGGEGEATTASNVGDGQDIFKQKVGADLQFRGVKSGNGVTATTDGDNIVITFDSSTMTGGQIDALSALVGGGGGSGGYGGTWYQDSTGDGTITGLINGTNVTFVLQEIPASPDSVILSHNGQILERGATDDYTISGKTITMVWAPESGKLTATYQAITLGTQSALTRVSDVASAIQGELYRNLDDNNSLYYKDHTGTNIKLVDETSNKIPESSLDLTTMGSGAIVRESAVPLLPNLDSSYPAGETLSAGNVVFIENAPTTAQATSAQNIGDVTANTRISFPAFGSGASASTLKLNLAKTGSPSVNLGVRIETDDGSGNPSGTLVNANATGTVTAASLTTSLADTTVTLAGAFSITAGMKCHVVTYQGTYGSETVNASNYYKIGCYTNHSTTRGQKLWNGSVHSAMDTVKVPYTSSTLFQPRVLSKTDADYTYKIDWHGIVQEAVTAGDLTTGKYPVVAIEGVDSNQTGMTQGTTMYLSNTAGSISSSAGTNQQAIGEAISSTKLQIKEYGQIPSSTAIATATPSVVGNDQTASGTLYTCTKAGFLEVKLELYNSTSGSNTYGSFTVTVYSGNYTYITQAHASGTTNYYFTIPSIPGKVISWQVTSFSQSWNTATISVY